MGDLATLLEVLPEAPKVPPSPVFFPPADRKTPRNRAGKTVFFVALVCGLAYIGVQVGHDLNGVSLSSGWPLVMPASKPPAWFVGRTNPSDVVSTRAGS